MSLSLVQALQSSLSLDANAQLPKPNMGAESPQKVSCEASADEHGKENMVKAKVPPAVSGGTGPSANTPYVSHEYQRDKIITPTATWPPSQDFKFDGVGCPTGEPACLTQEAKPCEVDKRDDLPKKLHLELKSPPTPARENEDLGRNDDGKKQTLEVITEIPEDVSTASGNCQQEVEESSPCPIDNGREENNYKYCANS